MKTRVNARAVVILLLGLIVLGAGVHFLHGYQVKRNARGVYEHALVLQEDGRRAEAADFLRQYIGMMPGDNEALGQLGMLLDDLAKTPRARVRAFFILDQVLRRDPVRKDIRRRVVRITIALGRYSDAKHHLKLLLDDAPEDAELFQFKGRCAAGEMKYEEADQWYTKALELAPNQIDLSVEYAALLRNRLDLPLLANAQIEAMVRANDGSPEAHLQSALYFRQHDRLDKAEKHVRFAMDTLGLEDADVLLLAADIARASNKSAEARKYLERGQQLHPKDARMARILAQLDAVDGDHKRVTEYLQKSLENLTNDPAELWELARISLLARDFERADIIARQLAKVGAAVPAQCVQAQLLMLREAWGEARRLLAALPLEGLRTGPDWARPLVYQVPFLLAICYENLANPDQRLQACQRAVEAEPRWPIARRGLAMSLMALGHTDRALNEYRRLARQSDAGRAELAELLIARNGRVPAAKQRWDEVEKLVKELGEPTPPNGPTSDAQLLRAKMLATQGKYGQARQLVEAERRRDPKQIAPWLFLAGLADLDGKSETVIPLFAEAERQAGKRVEWDLARTRYWALHGGKEAPARLRQLHVGLDQHNKDDRNRLLRALAEAFDRLGESAAAEELWRQLANAQPNDLSIQLVLLERVLRPDRVAEAEALVAAVKRIEGDVGPAGAYAEAARLVIATVGDQPEPLSRARALLERAAELRPSWARVYALEAEILDRQDRRDKALEKYQAALDRGEGRPRVVRRVLQLLYEQQRYAEAQALVRKMPERALDERDVGRIAAALALQQSTAASDREQSHEYALKLARKAAASPKANYQDHLWLGQVAAAVGKNDEAAQAFRRARALANTERSTWIALVLFLASHDAKQAEAELQTAAAKLIGEDRAIVLAAGHEALGRVAQAEEQYRALLAAKSADPSLLVQTVKFYKRTGLPTKAEAPLRTLIAPATRAPQLVVTWARRELALGLCKQGAYSAFREALALVATNAAQGESTEDRWVKAVVLATRPAHRKEAIQLIETLPGPSAGGARAAKALLAQLYERDGNWPKARTMIAALVSEETQDRQLVAATAGALLRHGETAAAAPWVERLTKLAPRDFVTVELQARLLKAQDKVKEAVGLVQAYAEQKDAQHEQAARLLDQLGDADAAEGLYRSLASSSGRPEATLALARHLAPRRLDEAMTLCEKAWQTCSPEAVAVSTVMIAHAGAANAAQQERMAAWLATASGKHPKSPDLAVAYADLLVMRGRHVDAIRLYRQVLQQKPQHVVALNNLAYLLAMTEGKCDEALVLIDQGLELTGPVAELLDTRAVVYLKAGKADAARHDLHEAIAQAPTPIMHFHLAQAHARANDSPAASAALRKAFVLGLEARNVSALEQPAYRQLVNTLKLAAP
jgi:tetratricopeptide (TPR) repeat protein